MEQQTEYTRITAEDRNDYICPLDLAQRKSTLTIDDLDDCVEAEVVGRYSGHLNIVDPT